MKIEEKLSQMKEIIKKEPRRFIAQEVIDFQDMKVSEGVMDIRMSDIWKESAVLLYS